MKNTKKPYFILGCLVLLFLAYQIMDTYGIFESNVGSEIENSLSKWQILVNSDDITGEISTFEIDEINWETNTGVVSGKAAPGLSGYFEIVIDPTGSEVSIEYEIYLDFLNLGNDMIYITSVEDSNKSPITLIDTNTYSGLLTLADIELGKIETIRVNVIWENDEDNNEIDSTYVGDESPFFDIPISIRLSQYIE